ncbi:hypothetical protein ADU37_CDS05040 [Thermococcus sp. 2319x1]|nr:hypothetical protein ADU37_CDS05040 [Thermococcus sp. 2319x1]
MHSKLAYENGFNIKPGLFVSSTFILLPSDALLRVEHCKTAS